MNMMKGCDQSKTKSVIDLDEAIEALKGLKK